MYQALVAASATRWRGSAFHEQLRPALLWLEKLQPTVIAPKVRGRSFGYRMYVPNNSGDLMTAAWARGDTETSMAKFRVEKDVRPQRLADEAIHFLFPLSDASCPYFGLLRAAARSVTHLGWSFDLVAGNAEIVEESVMARLEGERWLPQAAGRNLRVPTKGTLDNVLRKHAAFLSRLSESSFKPVPPLTAFQVVGYRRETDPAAPTFTPFSLLKPDGSGFRAFNPARHTCTVAGMMRHAAAQAAESAGWKPEEWGTLVLGHGEARNEPHQPVGNGRLAFLPVPSIEGRGEGKRRVVGAIRRVLVVSMGNGLDDKVAWARRALAGTELYATGKLEPEAFLGSIPKSDSVLKSYLQTASTWATVSPVVLPGYDDPAHYRRRMQQMTDAEEKKRLLQKLDARVDGLLRKAIRQAGYSATLAENAELEWRNVAFWPGVDLASRYFVPRHLEKHSRLHVRITWRDAQGNPIEEIPGPICIGGGRFGGLGLFAAVDG
jgi:CRISPR-associated protein Csb2